MSRAGIRAARGRRGPRTDGPSQVVSGLYSGPMPLGDKVEGLRRAIASRSARFGLGPAAKPRGSGRPLPLAAWMLLIGLFGIGVLVYGFWDQQYELIKVLRIQDPVDEVAIAEARNDILRTTLTATAGLAAAAVLLLNFQKQRHEEYNSTQQRIADLRIQAVQQLGSASPSVRIGGLHNLERLGEAHPELRQIVLDEICSYLRLDYAPGTEGEAPSEGDRAELQGPVCGIRGPPHRPGNPATPPEIRNKRTAARILEPRQTEPQKRKAPGNRLPRLPLERTRLQGRGVHRDRTL